MAHGREKATHSGTVTDTEVSAMATVLARRYCDAAIDIALQFAGEHHAIGDLSRARTWNRVVECLRERTPAPTLS